MPSAIFHVGTAESIPIESASIDLVVSSISLHHWADPLQGLREAGRVVRGGGCFCLAVLLSVRDADRWHDSVMNTIYPVMKQRPPVRAPEILHDFQEMVHALIIERTFEGRLEDRAHAKRVFEAHNQAVMAAIPASRLLVYQPGDGWEPICRFLGVPVPDADFPHVNDTAWYRARTGLPAIEPHR
jgi:ubiquinone/menaquinone biosynthesis C-methylase UbiE